MKIERDHRHIRTNAALERVFDGETFEYVSALHARLHLPSEENTTLMRCDSIHF